ncbi:MAG: patatin-like phospholipase family protein [Desulfocucumaceae bacterium]
MKADAVFEGGGVKGIALAGAICYAQKEKNIEWQNVAGTSAGAIMAALVASNHSAEEIKEIIFGLDFSLIKDKGFIDHFLLPGKTMSLLFEKGIYEGRFIEKFIEDLLLKKGVSTFGDLRMEGENNPRYRYRLNVIASDISRGKMLVLPQDIRAYGLDPDSFSVARAVRMTMSIPVFYEPVSLDYWERGKSKRSYIVDGGILSNFPVWLFDSEGEPEWPTFGFRLVEPGREEPRSINNIIDFLSAMIGTMIEAHDERYIQDANFTRTIAIPTRGIKTTEFDISAERKEILFQSGYSAAKKYFDTYSEEVYKKIHPLFARKGTP